MTVSMLERVLTSKVENLHIRVDEWVVWARSFDDRLSSVERQLGLLTLAVEELRVETRTNYATKEDLAGLATKEDLKQYITIDTLELVVKGAVDTAVEAVLLRFGLA